MRMRSGVVSPSARAAHSCTRAPTAPTHSPSTFISHSGGVVPLFRPTPEPPPSLLVPLATSIYNQPAMPLPALLTASWLSSPALDPPSWTAPLAPLLGTPGLGFAALPPVVHLSIYACVASFALQWLSSVISPRVFGRHYPPESDQRKRDDWDLHMVRSFGRRGGVDDCREAEQGRRCGTRGSQETTVETGENRNGRTAGKAFRPQLGMRLSDQRRSRTRRSMGTHQHQNPEGSEQSVFFTRIKLRKEVLDGRRRRGLVRARTSVGRQD